MFRVNKMKVRVFSTTWCVYCRMAKEFLKQKNVKFEDINIEENPEKAKEMVKLSGQTAVPVIDVDGKIIVGFDKERLKKNLRLK